MLYVVAIKVDSTPESPLEKPPEYLSINGRITTVGPWAEMTRNFLSATFFKTVEEAREGLKLVTGLTPSTNQRGTPWPQGFHIRHGLSLNFDNTHRSGEIGIYPVIMNGKIATLPAVEMTYVEAELTTTSAFKASKIDGAFKYNFVGAPKKTATHRPQLELFIEEQPLEEHAAC